MDALASIARDSALFLDAVRAAPPGARVPACPEWRAADLTYHLAEVQDFWSAVVGPSAGRGLDGGDAVPLPRPAVDADLPLSRPPRPAVCSLRSRGATLPSRAGPGTTRAGPSGGSPAARPTRRSCTASMPSRPPDSTSRERTQRSLRTASTRSFVSWSTGSRRGRRSPRTGPRSPWPSTDRARFPGRGSSRSGVSPGPDRSPARPTTWTRPS
ncbi:maleylpyruvate isomerase N-terminal domain-containing protein [Oerskovia sp. M15]